MSVLGLSLITGLRAHFFDIVDKFYENYKRKIHSLLIRIKYINGIKTHRKQSGEKHDNKESNVN